MFYPGVREIGTQKAEDMVLEEMTVLKELIAHHVEEEEDEMFPMAEKRLGRERSHELAEEMAERARA